MCESDAMNGTWTIDSACECADLTWVSYTTDTLDAAFLAVINGDDTALVCVSDETPGEGGETDEPCCTDANNSTCTDCLADDADFWDFCHPLEVVEGS